MELENMFLFDEGDAGGTPPKNQEEQPQETPPANNGGSKTFSQEDVNKIIADRLAREREKHQEDIRKLTDGFNEKEQSYLAKEEEYSKTMAETNKKILGYQNNIIPEKLDEALAVADIRSKKDNITLEEALVKVASEYTTFVNKSSAGGVEIKNSKSSNDNPYLTEALLKRYPHLAKTQNKK